MSSGTPRTRLCGQGAVRLGLGRIHPASSGWDRSPMKIGGARKKTGGQIVNRASQPAATALAGSGSTAPMRTIDCHGIATDTGPSESSGEEGLVAGHAPPAPVWPTNRSITHPWPRALKHISPYHSQRYRACFIYRQRPNPSTGVAGPCRQGAECRADTEHCSGRTLPLRSCAPELSRGHCWRTLLRLLIDAATGEHEWPRDPPSA